MPNDVCADRDAALSLWVDGDLPAEATRDVEGHLAACPRCRAVADELAAIRRVAGELEPIEPPARVWSAVASRLDPAPSRPVWWRSWPVGLVGAAAAAGLAMVITGGDPRVSRSAEPGDDAAALALRAAADELDQAEQEFTRALEAFHGEVEAARAAGGAATDVTTALAQVEATLRAQLLLVDAAIDESRLALAEQPTSEIARRSLVEGTWRKADVLHQAMALTMHARGAR